MEHRSLLRLFGLCSFIGGVMIVFLQAWFYVDPISFVATYFDQVGWAFITIGIIGLYLLQYRHTGGVGVFSFLILLLAMFQWLGYKWFLTFAAPDLRRNVPELLDSGLQSVVYGAEVSDYFLQISFFLFAVITLFKGTLSRGASSLLLIGSAIAFNAQMEEVILYNPLIPQVLIGLAFAWFGISLFKILEKDTYEDLNLEDFEQGSCGIAKSEYDGSHEKQESSSKTKVDSVKLDEDPHSAETNSEEYKQEVRTSS
ncbi:hypothetical protein R4Z10_12230 [Niallia sp. XMNu-256]|uniref:hypothetical protein n=1 Tax=Niallia sp. XMNu-256 TaxID=3082444 RepID=UPI0030D07040